MKTKVAVAILALFATTPARGEDGVIHVCPVNLQVKPVVQPAGWPDASGTVQPFKEAWVSNGRISCGYAVPNQQNSVVVAISRPTNGMVCKVNASNPRQVDCLPGARPGVGFGIPKP